MSEANPYRGLPCKLCGKPVKAKDSPAQFHTDVIKGEKWALHLACKDFDNPKS